MDGSHEEAVSEEIAAVLLIAVCVAAAAVAGLALISSHPGSAPPAMLVHLDDDALADGRIVLCHDGGDPLERGHFQILVDGRDLTDAFTTLEGSGAWTTWTNGEVLVLDLETRHEPADLRIVSDGVGEDGSRWLLHTLRDGGGSPGPTVTPTMTPTIVPTPTPVPLVAHFTADPATGTAPLTVQFNDLSTGSPTSWSWDFGDGETSSWQHPAHTYGAPGTYTAILTAKNSAGADTASRTIMVTAPPVKGQEITLVTSPPKDGTLEGTFAFTVTGPWSYLQVGGEHLALVQGDRVELTLMGDQKGMLHLAEATITTFEFPDVQVSVNDEIVGTGAIGSGGIWISGYEDSTSTLTLSVEPETAWTSLLVDGGIVVEDWEDGHGVVLSTLIPDSTGVMNLDLTGVGEVQREVFYRGGAENYTLV